MKNYIIISLLAVLMVGCEDFLDTDDLVRKNSGNFPLNKAELDNALAGAYAMFCTADRQGDCTFFWSTILSDECFGNGGNGDHNWQAHNQFLRSGDNAHSSSWRENYKGIYRCNSILDALETNPDIAFSSTAERDQYLGEVYALRAWYYYELVLMFGPYVPLRLQPKVENLPAANSDELFAQIADDLNKSISLLPSKKIQELGSANLGHFTRWAVQAYMARVFLFYTGYYKKSELPTLSGSISKQQVIAWLEDCINNSGHGLLSDYRNNYVYGNAYTAPDYKYAVDNQLSWVGDTGDNIESVFALKFSIFTDNRWGLLFGIRSLSKPDLFPFRDGWGSGSVNPKFFDQWLADEPTDIRRNASILDLSDSNENMNYIWGGDQGEETGYVIKKVQNVNAYDATRKIVNYSLIAYGGNDGQGHSAVNQIMIRFSEVLLMHSELVENNEGLNRVRSRVNLPPVAYSFEAIQKERRYELAFDGIRFYDLLRWYGMDAGTVIDANQNGAIYYRIGNTQTMNGNVTKRIRDTGGFLEIPKTEIDLSEGVLKQNQGWVGDNILFRP